MRKHICLIMLFLSLIATGCNDDKLITIPSSFRNQAIELSAEQMMSDTSGATWGFYTLQDSIVLGINKLKDGLKYLDIYQLHTGEKISSQLPYGRGPGEVLTPGLIYMNDRIIFGDMIKKGRGTLTISDLSDPDLKPCFEDKRFESQSYPFKGRFVACNFFYFSNEDLAISKNCDIGKLIYIEPDDDRTLWEIVGDHLYNTSAVCKYAIAASETRNRIVLADKMNPIIEIYDEELNLEKRIRIEDDLPIKYLVTEQYGSLVVPVKNVMAFCSLLISENGFYTSYLGEYMDRKKQKNEYSTYIMNFNWDGDLLDVYKYGCQLDYLSLSREMNTFYATAYDEEDNPVLVKLYPSNSIE